MIIRLLMLMFLATEASGRSLNFIEAHQLRLSTRNDGLTWINPFFSARPAEHFDFRLFFSNEKDVLGLYKDIQSKDQPKIQQRLSESYGKPYDVSAKVGMGFHYGRFSQHFSTNGGALLFINDPVFPEMDGLIFHDYVTTSSYAFGKPRNWVLRPRISLGWRKMVDEKFTAGDLVQRPLKVNFEKKPYTNLFEMGLNGSKTLGEYGDLIGEVNAIPLIKSDGEYEYWDTFLGYRSWNFLDDKGSWLHALHAYGGYSPFYAGDYDVERTIKTGIDVQFIRHLRLDLFTMDKFYPGLIFSTQFQYIEFNLFTYERGYDDFGRQRSRQYGANLRFLF